MYEHSLLKEELEESKMEIEKLREKLASKPEPGDQSSAEREQLINERDQFKKELEESKAKIEKLQEEVTCRIQIVIDLCSAERNELINERNQLKQQLEESTLTIKSLREKLMEEAECNDLLSAERNQLIQQLDSAQSMMGGFDEPPVSGSQSREEWYGERMRYINDIQELDDIVQKVEQQKSQLKK
jgi:chromosome segregation ATPase